VNTGLRAGKTVKQRQDIPVPAEQGTRRRKEGKWEKKPYKNVDRGSEIFHKDEKKRAG